MSVARMPRVRLRFEALNTNSSYYGGSGLGNMGVVTAEAHGWHDQPFSAEVTLPPLSVIWLRP